MKQETADRIIRVSVVGLARIMPHDYDDAEKAGAFADCATIGDKAEALLRWKLAWLNSIRTDKPQTLPPGVLAKIEVDIAYNGRDMLDMIVLNIQPDIIMGPGNQWRPGVVMLHSADSIAETVAFAINEGNQTEGEFPADADNDDDYSNAAIIRWKVRDAGVALLKQHNVVID